VCCSDFIELQPVDKYKENEENIKLGIDPISEYEESKDEEEEEVLMPPEENKIEEDTNNLIRFIVIFV
jgi:pyruvate/2-oxoacid:ferredoxin oxidoreductase beta subunit